MIVLMFGTRSKSIEKRINKKEKWLGAYFIPVAYITTHKPLSIDSIPQNRVFVNPLQQLFERTEK